MPKKRSDGRYELKVRVSAPTEPRRYKAVYGSTLREAQERKRQLEAEVAAGLETSQRPTVTALADYYLALRSTQLRPQTVNNYRHALAHITKRIGEAEAKTITVDGARKVIGSIVSDISPNQGIRARKLACMVWDDAITRSVLLTNPWRSVPVPKKDVTEKRFLTEQELRQLDEAPLTPYDRAIVTVLRYSGLRIGEATALQVKDIDLVGGYIHVTKTNVDGEIFPPKTAASKRNVPMPTVLRSALSDYINTYTDGKPNTYLFSASGKTPWGKATIWRHFEEIGRITFGTASEDFTPHIFRHTYTHDLAANGIPPLTAQVLLGHSSYAITLKTYAHFGWKDVATDTVVGIFDKKVLQNERQNP